MMRKPIFTGIATILTLALTAGLAYGAGRLVSTRNDANQVGQQDPRVVAVQPGFHGFDGAMFRHQMRGWMRDRFASFRGRMSFAGNHGAPWGRNCDRSSCMNQGTSFRSDGYPHQSDYQGGSSSHFGGEYQDHSGYHGNHRGSGSWGAGINGGWGGNRGGCCGW